MSEQYQTLIIRRHELLKRFGISNNSLYTKINEGTLPPPISLGSRAVGWLEHELDSVLAAMAIGKSQAEIKSLVKDLIHQRHNLAISAGLNCLKGAEK